MAHMTSSKVAIASAGVEAIGKGDLLHPSCVSSIGHISSLGIYHYFQFALASQVNYKRCRGSRAVICGPFGKRTEPLSRLSRLPNLVLVVLTCKIVMELSASNEFNRMSSTGALKSVGTVPVDVGWLYNNQ